jgi:hypothetical protein
MIKLTNLTATVNTPEFIAIAEGRYKMKPFNKPVEKEQTITLYEFHPEMGCTGNWLKLVVYECVAEPEYEGCYYIYFNVALSALSTTVIPTTFQFYEARNALIMAKSNRQKISLLIVLKTKGGVLIDRAESIPGSISAYCALTHNLVKLKPISQVQGYQILQSEFEQLNNFIKAQFCPVD